MGIPFPFSRKSFPAKIAVSGPNWETIDFIKTTQCRTIAEVGIWKGFTSREFARFLDGNGELHLYDFQDNVDLVKRKLHSEGFTNVKAFGCSYKYLDSYNWSLAQMLKQHGQPLYDYVFLDGAHTWAVDALATLLLDKLLKVGGYIDFDDHDWTLQRSPSLNPKSFSLTGKLYTEEQIEAQQVKMIVDLLIRADSRYVEVVPNKIFRKMRG